MTRTLTRRGLFGAAGALLAAPVFPTPLHAAFARGTVTGRTSSSQPNVQSIPRSAYAVDGRQGYALYHCKTVAPDSWRHARDLYPVFIAGLIAGRS